MTESRISKAITLTRFLHKLGLKAGWHTYGEYWFEKE